MGGGPADLVFPDQFAGIWQVRSTLVSVELPLGKEYVPDMKVVERAQTEDLNKATQYEIAFTRNSAGRVVPDRRYNTAALMGMYYGGIDRFLGDIEWNKDDPNDLKLQLPGGGVVDTRVTRRSEAQPETNKIETSEYFRQTFQSGAGASARVKASQCFTKYKWRSAAEAKGGPEVVATQVVSDYLTSFDDDATFLKSMGKAVTIYTYRMAFTRKADQRLELLS